MATDKQQLQQLYERSYGFVHHRACLLLGNDEEAKDVAQEAFLRAWRRWSEVQRCSSPLAWLMTTTTRLCLDRHRHHKVVDRHRARIKTPAGHPRAEERLDAQRVLSLLGKTRRLTQLIVIHALIDGMTQDETADALDISRKTVQRHLSRFRAKAERNDTEPRR